MTPADGLKLKPGDRLFAVVGSRPWTGRVLKALPEGVIVEPVIGSFSWDQVELTSAAATARARARDDDQVNMTWVQP